MKVAGKGTYAPTCWYIVVSLLLVVGVASAQKNKPKSAPPPPAAHAAAPAAHPSAPPQSHPAAPPANASHGNNASQNNTAHGNTAGHGNSPATGTNTAQGANHTQGANAGHTNNATNGTNANTGAHTGTGANAGHPGAATNANNAGHTGAGGANLAHSNNGKAPAGQAKGPATAGGANPAHPGAAVNNGHSTTTARAVHTPPTTVKQIHTHSGQTVQASYRGGHVRTIQAHNMTIEHRIGGPRHVVVEHNGRRIVAMGPNRGFAQRAYYRRGNVAYVQRTYYAGGQRYAYAYRTYYYGGRPYYGYAPAYYYRPVYYGWAANPWPQPVYYNWGWQQQPWYGYYGQYYQPYPAYPSASSWLTDHTFADYLKEAYEARQSANALTPMGFASSPMLASLASSDALVSANLIVGQILPGATWAAYMPAGKDAQQAQISPEVKQAISDEIKSQIDAEKNAASNSDSQQAGSGGDQLPALDPNHKVFIVFSNLDASTNDGQECQLSAGDVLFRTGDSLVDEDKVEVAVKSSQKDDCPVGTNTEVAADDLQEMQNHLREHLDAGLKDLADKQGKNGIPAAPDTHTTNGEVPAPAADSTVQTDLQQAQKDADQTEAEVQQDSSGQEASNH